jgi:hypothetical protein
MVNQARAESDLDNEEICLTDYVVLFADVLGQKEAILRLETLPTSAAQSAEYMKSLKASAGTVLGVRKYVENFINGFENAPPVGDISKLPPEAGQAYAECRKSELRQQRFCDTVILYDRLRRREDKGQLHVMPIFAMVAGAAVCQLTCLAGKTPVRCGIAVGIALELSGNDIYGPAAIRAHELEAKEADWPRIVVNQRLVKCLQEVRDHPETSFSRNAERVIAVRTLDLLEPDKEKDDIWSVDFLGRAMRDLPGAAIAQKSRDAAIAGFDFVKKEHAKFARLADKSEGNARLASKYTALREYYEKRMPYWYSLR